MTTFLLSVLSVLFFQAGIASTPADTVNRYIIDRKEVVDFDGSQLIGRKIESYSVYTLNGDAKIFRVHDITTDLNYVVPQPLVIVDGKVLSMAEFEKIDPASIQCVNVYKAKAAEGKFSEYGDTSGGVIVIELKEPGSYTPSDKKLGNRIIRISKDKKILSD